jgi:carboxymethylenebutenolidase
MKRKILLLLITIVTSISLSAQNKNKNSTKPGEFIIIKGNNGKEYRAFAAGPPDAMMSTLFVHDYFGISDATKESVQRLGALGYYTIAIDLYKGKSATTNEAAESLMKSKDDVETTATLRAAIDHLKRPGRKLAAIGFSAGGFDAMNATLMEPDLFKATVIVYGGGYDKIEKAKLNNLKNPVLVTTGALDSWPMQAAINFLTNEKDKLLELYVYPGADHGYAQPLFNGGKNYNPEAKRVTWMLMEDFLQRCFDSKSN